MARMAVTTVTTVTRRYALRYVTTLHLRAHMREYDQYMLHVTLRYNVTCMYIYIGFLTLFHTHESFKGGICI